MLLGAVLMTVGCGSGKYVSADRDLEEIYVGKTYYEIVGDFGRPDATMQDGMEGTKAAYNAVSLSGTRAAGLYKEHKMRNRITKREDAPTGGVTFSFGADMKCYAVDSDFQRERTKEVKEEKPVEQTDNRLPVKIKPKVPRTIDYPYYVSKSPFAENISIEKVEVERKYLKIYFMYRDRTPEHATPTDDGLFIMPEVYVEDCATLKRYNMIDHSGIALYPERSYFAENQGGYDILLYSLTFEPLSESTEYIDIIEPGHSGYNFYRVDIRTPMSTKEELKNK